jgi:hypothetical protein
MTKASAASPPNNSKSLSEEPVENPSVTNAEWWAGLWENIEHWAFLGVVLTLAIEFAASHLLKAPRKIIDDARQLELVQLTREAETLRNQNLELEKAISPRVLGQATTVEALLKFAGVPFVVVSPSDFEPRRTAAQIRYILDEAKWVRFTEPLNLPPFSFLDGISVHVMGVISEPNDPAKAAAQALVSLLNDNGIVAALGFPPMRHDGQGRPILLNHNPVSPNPPNVVIVEVGPKPLPESLKMGPPPGSSGALGNKTWGNTAE